MIQKSSDNQCSGSQHHLQDQKKARVSLSKLKDMFVFFYIQVIVMAEWVPSGQTVNQQYYVEVLTKLHERVRSKRQES
jgi:hypothetical protein